MDQIDMKTLLLLGLGPQFAAKPAEERINWIIGRNILYRRLEIQIANTFARSFDKVYLLTYEDQEYAKQFAACVAASVEVLFRPRGIPLVAYGPLAPLIHRRQFRAASVCETLELRGAITALLCKLLLRHENCRQAGLPNLRSHQNNANQRVSPFAFTNPLAPNDCLRTPSMSCSGRCNSRVSGPQKQPNRQIPR